MLGLGEKSPKARASQSRPVLGYVAGFIQPPCSRQRMCILVSARLQATAAPDAPAPTISTSTGLFMPVLPSFVPQAMIAHGPSRFLLIVDANVAFFVERDGGLSLPHVATRREHLDQPRDIYGVLRHRPARAAPSWSE